MADRAASVGAVADASGAAGGPVAAGAVVVTTAADGPAATIANLDTAEELLFDLLRDTRRLTGELVLGNSNLDVAAAQAINASLLDTLAQVHDRVAGEITHLVKYIPFERSSYGSKKDAQVAREKLSFARTFLRETLLPTPPTAAAATMADPNRAGPGPTT